MTKEERKEYMKRYREANKEKIAAQRKGYHLANREKRNAQRKSYKAILEHDYCIYILPKERYIGMTKNITDRIYNHNSDGINTEGFRVLQYFDTRQEASDRESWLHSKGYKGSVKQILEQR